MYFSLKVKGVLVNFPRLWFSTLAFTKALKPMVLPQHAGISNLCSHNDFSKKKNQFKWEINLLFPSVQ